jgi:hypothetical protein
MGRPYAIDDKLEEMRGQMRGQVSTVEERFKEMQKQNQAMLENLAVQLSTAKSAVPLPPGMDMGKGGVTAVNLAATAAAAAGRGAAGQQGAVAQAALSGMASAGAASTPAPAPAANPAANLNREGFLMMKVTGEKGAGSFFGMKTDAKWEKVFVKLRAASSQLVYYDSEGGDVRGQSNLTKKGNIWLKDCKELVENPPKDSKNLKDHTFHLPMRNEDIRVFMFAADDGDLKLGWVESVQAVFIKATKHRRK